MTAALWRVLDAFAATPFEYGRHDCCLLVARCLDAQFGTDYAAALGRCYTDRRSARRFIAVHGDLEGAVSSFLGPLLRRLPRRGEAALVRTEDGPGVGVCVGDTIAVAADVGVQFYPISEALGAWERPSAI